MLQEEALHRLIPPESTPAACRPQSTDRSENEEQGPWQTAISARALLSKPSQRG